MTDKQIRARILEVAERVLIKRNGDIHAYGRMPNTNTTGWYYYGDRNAVALQFAEEAEAGERK